MSNDKKPMNCWAGMTSLNITKGYLELEQGVRYCLITGDYYGSCKEFGYYRIKSLNIAECAAVSSSVQELELNLVRNRYFDTCSMGGGFIPLVVQIRQIICNHYWDSYKAITG